MAKYLLRDHPELVDKVWWCSCTSHEPHAVIVVSTDLAYVEQQDGNWLACSGDTEIWSPKLHEDADAVWARLAAVRLLGGKIGQGE